MRKSVTLFILFRNYVVFFKQNKIVKWSCNIFKIDQIVKWSWEVDKIIWSSADTIVLASILWSEQYGNTGCGDFKRRVTKLERFLPKNQHTQRKLLNFEKVKWFKNWCYQKMSITKNVLLNWYSSMKKKWERFG